MLRSLVGERPPEPAPELGADTEYRLGGAQRELRGRPRAPPRSASPSALRVGRLGAADRAGARRPGSTTATDELEARVTDSTGWSELWTAELGPGRSRARSSSAVRSPPSACSTRPTLGAPLAIGGRVAARSGGRGRAPCLSPGWGLAVSAAGRGDRSREPTLDGTGTVRRCSRRARGFRARRGGSALDRLDRGDRSRISPASPMPVFEAALEPRASTRAVRPPPGRDAGHPGAPRRRRARTRRHLPDFVGAADRACQNCGLPRSSGPAPPAERSRRARTRFTARSASRSRPGSIATTAGRRPSRSGRRRSAPPAAEG